MPTTDSKTSKLLQLLTLTWSGKCKRRETQAQQDTRIPLSFLPDTFKMRVHSRWHRKGNLKQLERDSRVTTTWESLKINGMGRTKSRTGRLIIRWEVTRENYKTSEKEDTQTANQATHSLMVWSVIRNLTEDQSLKMVCILANNLAHRDKLCPVQLRINKLLMCKISLPIETSVQRLVFPPIMFHPLVIKLKEDFNSKYKPTMVEFSL